MPEGKIQEEVKPVEASVTTVASASTATPKKSGNKTLVIILGVLGVLALCAVIGVVSIVVVAKRAVDKAGISVSKDGTTIKTEDGSITYNENGTDGTIKTDEGELQYGSDLKLPSDFPNDVPMHSKGSITAVSTTLEDGTFLAMSIKSSYDEVSNYYKTAFVKEGWTKTTESSIGMLSFKKGTRVASLIMNEENGMTQLILTLTTEE